MRLERLTIHDEFLAVAGEGHFVNFLNRADLDELGVVPTMMTKIMKNSKTGANDTGLPGEPGARGGGWRRGKHILQTSFIVRWDVALDG